MKKTNQALQNTSQLKESDPQSYSVRCTENEDINLNRSINHLNSYSILDKYISTASEYEDDTLSILLGLLKKVYRFAAGENFNPQVYDILEIYKYFPNILTSDNLIALSKHLNMILQHTVQCFIKTNEDAIGIGQPNEVTKLICRFADIDKNATVYTPFASTFPFATCISNNIVGEESNNLLWAIGQIRMFAIGAGHRVNVALNDSFQNLKNEVKYKAILAPTISIKAPGLTKAHTLRMLYDKLENGGTLACMVPLPFFFSIGKNSEALRKDLITSRAIRSITILPSEIFPGREMHRAILVITKSVVNEKIIFADATHHKSLYMTEFRQTSLDANKFIKDYNAGLKISDTEPLLSNHQPFVSAIPYTEIDHTNLSPSVYLSPKPENSVPLTVLAEIISEFTDCNTTDRNYLKPTSIPASMHRKAFSPSTDNFSTGPCTKKRLTIPHNAVIIALAGGNIRTVYTDTFTGDITISPDLITVLKPKQGVSAKYLAAIISTEIVANQIKAFTIGMASPSLAKIDFKKILIPTHKSPNEQEQLISEVLSSEMSDLEGELQDTLLRQKREVRSTRHAMIQTLSALSANWEQLKIFSNIHKDGIKLSDIVGRINPISVEQLMGSIEHAISTLQRQVESLRLEKTDLGKFIAINPHKAINDYIATHSTPSIRMTNIGIDIAPNAPYFEDESDCSPSISSFTFHAPKRLLERIFNNIVANAKAHGFNKDHHDNEIRFDWKSENNAIIITIANNGAPLKQNVTGDDVLMNGFSTALNEDAADGTLHSGQGGFEIKSLMEGLGKAEVISQPNAEFPVIYKLTFEKNIAE